MWVAHLKAHIARKTTWLEMFVRCVVLLQERAPREFSRRMDRIWAMAQTTFKGNEVELTAVRAEIEVSDVPPMIWH